MFWQELSRFQVYSYVASETKLYVVSQTSNFYNLPTRKRNLCVVTRTVNLPNMHMQKSAMLQSSYKMSSHKKCQVKSEGTQSSHMQSVPKTACKQIGTQPEVTRNNVHTVLSTHDHFVCQQALCEHSASKSCYPFDTTKVSLVSRKYKKQTNQSDSRSSKMQSPQKRSVNLGKM